MSAIKNALLQFKPTKNVIIHPGRFLQNAPPSAPPVCNALLATAYFEYDWSIDQPITLSGGSIFTITKIVFAGPEFLFSLVNDAQWWTGEERTGNKLADTGSSTLYGTVPGYTYIQTNSSIFLSIGNPLPFTEQSFMEIYGTINS